MTKQQASLKRFFGGDMTDMSPFRRGVNMVGFAGLALVVLVAILGR